MFLSATSALSVLDYILIAALALMVIILIVVIVLYQRKVNALKKENASLKKTVAQQKKAAEATNAKLKRSEAQTSAITSSLRRPTIETTDEKDDVPDSPNDEYEVTDEFADDEQESLTVTVKFDRLKNSWIIVRSDSDRVVRRIKTKQEALEVGRDVAKQLKAHFRVHKKDGKFQKV